MTEAADKRYFMALGLAGILGPLIYVAASIIGDALRPDYDFVRDSVSELIETGAPNKALLDSMIGIYHAFVMAFALGIYQATPRTPRSWIAPALIGGAGLVGIVITLFFPCDVGCEANPTTFAGQGHGVLVGVSVLLVAVAMLLLWRQLILDEAWAGHGRYTAWTLLFAVVTGAASFAFLNSDYVGLVERIGVLVVLQWYVVTGVRIVRDALRVRSV